VAALESLNFLNYGVGGSDFSEQQIVSCSTVSPYLNNGCAMGYIGKSFNYVRDIGVATENDYPYASLTSTTTAPCKDITGFTLFKISGFTALNNCPNLAASLALRPIAVEVDARKMSYYKNGTFNNCRNNSNNHAVLLVGVNSTHWKIKNSWRATWGTNGFMDLDATNGNNTCGICNSGRLPLP